MNINQAFQKTTGLTVEEGMKKAIEGGYTRYRKDHRVMTKQFSTIFLDPLFWQSLGKVEGWSENVLSSGRKIDQTSPGQIYQLKPVWFYQFHRFIDYLCEPEEINP